MARAEDRTGTWMLIHQVTATYLLTPGYDPTLGEHLHNWNLYPLRTEAHLQGHLWDLTKQKDGTYLIATKQEYGHTGKVLYLEASAKTDTENHAYVRQQYQNSSELQNWILEPVSLDNKTYAIRPKIFGNHALGLYSNHCTNDKSIVANCTYGNPTIHHYWRLSKPFD